MSANPLPSYIDRTAERYELSEPLPVIVEPFGSVSLFDISVAGARIGHDVAVAPGERVRVHLKVEEIGCSMTLPGKVIWTRDGRSLGAEEVEFSSGVAFDDIVHPLRLVIARLCVRRGARRIEEPEALRDTPNPR